MGEKNSKRAMIRPFIFKSTKIQGNYRSSTDFKSEILNLAQKGVTRYRIFYALWTTYRQLDKYLKNLNDSGLLKIEEIEGRKVYFTTEKGRRWLEKYHELKEIEKER